jgi:hypothetical protein
MAKEYTPEGLAGRLFLISMVGIGLFIASVFIFVL